MQVTTKHYNNIVTQLVGKKPRHEEKSTTRDGFQVFVSIPQQGRNCLTLKLKGNESMDDLREKVRTLTTGLELTGSMNLTSQGLRLTSSSQLIANATITVSANLLGGMSDYALFQEVRNEVDSTEESLFQTETADENCTLFGAMDIFETYYPKKSKNDYKFDYTIGGKAITIEGDPDGDQNSKQQYAAFIAQTLKDLGHVTGGTITVNVTITEKVAGDKAADEQPYMQFLEGIPYCQLTSVRRAIGEILEADQQKRMSEFVNKQMQREELHKILNVMTDYQMDNLLLDFCDIEKHKKAMLEYLLTRAGQWNETSERASMNASERTKSEQMRRIIQTFDNQWDEEDENDKIVAEIFEEEQEKVLDGIFANMESVQRIELLMLWLTPKQRCQLMIILQPQDVRHFWQLLKQDRRMQIFNGVERSVQFQFGMTEIYLEPLQKKKIWDNFSTQNKIDLWNSCMDPTVIKDFWKNEFEIELAQPATGSLLANQFALQILNPLKMFEKKADIKKVKILQRKLLNQLTINQRAAFWAIQDEDQQCAILDHISDDTDSNKNEIVEFWSILNHSKRCQMINQLPHAGLMKLFLAMDLEDKAQLIVIVNEDLRKDLKELLNDEQRRDLFLYSHFEKTDKTLKGSEQFINELVDDFYTDNNQVVPFDKIEDGYVQCIRDSRRNDHFFTVQIVEPQYVVENHDMPYVEDETKRAYFTDEAIGFDLAKKERNDTFRFVQNYYGELKETSPDESRCVGKAKNLAIISSQLASNEKGIWNEHSFFAENPVIFAHSHHTNPALTANEDILFTGNNKDIFFFNYVNATVEMSKDCKQRHSKLDLCLQILNKDLNANKGETSRQTSENCQTVRINPKSKLFDYIKNGSFEMNKFAEIFILNTVPTIIEGNNDKYVVFSHCQKSADGKIESGLGQGPTLYFFSVKLNREVFQVKGGEAFIDWCPANQKALTQCSQGKLTILANKELMMTRMWSNNHEIKRDDAGKFLKASENERKNAIVISININLAASNHAAITDFLPVEGGRIMRYEIEDDKKDDIEEQTNQVVAKINPTKNSFFCNTVSFVATIDMKDEDKVFAQRYLRKTPVECFVHDRNQTTQEIQSFTILFKELQSFSFSFIQVEGRLNATQQKECQAEFDNLSVEIQGIVAELEEMGDTNGMKPVELQEYQNKQKGIEAKKKEKEGVFTSKIPKYDQFKCKYFVPNASCLFFQKRAKKTYVQVTNGNENAQLTAKDNLRDVNTFEIQLFSISQLNVKSDTIESIPTKDNTSVKAPMSRQALTAYANNSAPMNKFGAVDIKATCCPIMQSKNGYQVGAFIYSHQDKNVKSQRVEWFRGRIAAKDLQQIQQQKQTFSVDYPLMVYKGYMPDNREIVLVNLADKENPQKILHLYDMQFICFVGHNFADRDCRIGMICVENDKFILCWLVCKQPFKKREINELDHYELHRYPIEFNVPIMTNIGGIIRVEFVQAVNSSIDNTSSGALLVQTTKDLYFSSNLTGYFESITNGHMADLTFQKGYNSTFYYCQIANDTDCIVNELYLHIVNGEWIFDVHEVMKTNEAMIIALEMDPENREKTDSIYTYDRSLIEQQEHVLNILYIVDDTENMWKMRQRGPEESGGRYEELKEINLSLGKNLTQEFTQYKKKGFNQMAITDRCISLNSINFNFYNGHSWPLDLTRDQDRNNQNKAHDLESSEDEDQKNDKQEGFGTSQVNSIDNISWTSRQIITCSYQDLVKESIQTTVSGDSKSNETEQKMTMKYKSTHAFVTKLHPGTRRQDLIGLRGLRDLESLNDISNDMFLIKFRGADVHGLSDYWTIIDKFGQIQRIPSKISRSLTWCNYSSGQSRQREDGTTLVLRGGQKKVLSFDTDVAYNEKKITQIDFNRRGEVSQVKKFRKTDYEKNMKKNIQQELLESPQQFFDGLTVNKQQALEISNNLEYQDEVLCTPSGDIYRIASIVDSRFSDDAAVNPRFQELSSQSDKLNMGIYCVKGEQNMKFKNTSRLYHCEKELKIVLFLCKKDQDRFLLNRAGFQVCGKYLCWSFPSEKSVHILDMTGMTKVKKRNEILFGITSAVFSGFKSIFATNGGSAVVGAAADDDGDDDFKQVGNSATKIRIRAESDESFKQEDDDVFNLNADKVDGYMNASSHNEIQSQSCNDSAQLCKTDYSQINETQVAFNSSEEEDLGQNQDITINKIAWESYETRTIDLALMCVNQNDEISMKISEVPKSLKFSIVNNSEGEEPTMRDNLLQVTVRDKTIIFNIETEDPQEKSFINATKQFINPNQYTDIGARVTLCYEDPSKADDGYLIDSIFANRRKDICFLRQDRLVANRHIKIDQLPKTPPILAIFKNYTEMDLKELQRIQEKITKHAKLDNIDYETLLSNFAGHTSFSIFSTEVKFHEQVNTQFAEDDFDEEVQEDEDIYENNILRRIYQVLTLPTADLESPLEEEKEEEKNGEMLDFEDIHGKQEVDEDVQEEEDQEEEEAQKGLKSVLKKSLHDKKNVRIKDCLLYIANKCAECNISTFCENQGDFQVLLGNLSQNALELINESFVSTAFTVKCMNSCWESDIAYTTFRQNTSRITEEQLSNKVQEQLLNEGYSAKEIGKSQVEVRMLDLSWMLNNGKNFVHFTKTLEDSSSEAIYETEFIDSLVAEFWNENYEKILYRCLLPWFSYAFLAQTYFINALADEHSQGWCTVLGILVLLNLSWQLRIEFKQMASEERVLDYLWDINNLMDLFQVTTTIWIVLSQTFWHSNPLPSIEMQRVLAAMSTLFLWIKVFDWLKLFSTTSFFVKLITETLIDIQHFIMIFFVAIFMFGVPMFILGMNSPADAEAPLIDEVFGSGWFFNSFYNQYMLSLGEFAMDGFGDSPQVILCYVLFLLATFITQITFLNMLVAIMGDSYSKVMEAKDRYGLQTRIDIMVNYTSLILDEDRDEDDRTYLFIVKPKNEGDEEAGGEWGGNLTLIKSTIDRALCTLQKSLDKKLEIVAQNLLDSKSRDKRMEKDMRGQYLRIMEKFIAIQEKFENIDLEKTDKIYDIVKRSQEDQKNSAKELKMATDKIHAEQTQLFKTKIQKANKEQKSAIQLKQKISNELSLVKKNQERMIQNAAASEQGASNEPNENDMAQHESVSQEMIAKMSEQQTSMISQLEEMRAQTQRIESSISDNARNQAALQNELQTSQSHFMQEIQELKNSKISFENKIKESVQVMEAENAQQQEAASSGGISDDQMASLQSLIQNMAANLTSQQSQMQESISEQQRVDKQQLMDLLAANPAEDDQ